MSRSLAYGFISFAVLLALSWRPAAADPRVFELAIRGGALPAEQRVLRVHVGDDVVLRWTSDRALTLHLHGYDIEVRVVPGAPTTMRLSARAAGRFPIELHDERPGREATLAYLEVHPR